MSHIDHANRAATIENIIINPNIKATDETMKNNKPNIQPLPVTILPIFLSLPCLVNGIPVNLEIFCLAELIPSALELDPEVIGCGFGIWDKIRIIGWING